MAQPLEILAQLDVVVELAVVGDRELPGRVNKRLVAALTQVDDRQAAMGEADLVLSVPLPGEQLAGEPGEPAVRWTEEIALAVGSAMLERVAHPDEHRRVEAARGDGSGYSAHDPFDSTRSITSASAFAGAG
jgi:hypothetical protein